MTMKRKLVVFMPDGTKQVFTASDTLSFHRDDNSIVVNESTDNGSDKAVFVGIPYIIYTTNEKDTNS